MIHNALVFWKISIALALVLALPACGNETAATQTSAATDAGEAQLVAEHVAVVQQRIQATNTKDWSTWEALHAPTAVRTAPGIERIEGSAAMRTAIEELVVTFPDYQLDLLDAFGSGDRLVARIHTKATMLGPMQIGATSLPATGKSFEQEWVGIFEFDAGRIVAIDEFYDNYSTLIQLGLASSP